MAKCLHYFLNIESKVDNYMFIKNRLSLVLNFVRNKECISFTLMCFLIFNFYVRVLSIYIFLSDKKSEVRVFGYI